MSGNVWEASRSVRQRLQRLQERLGSLQETRKVVQETFKAIRKLWERTPAPKPYRRSVWKPKGVYKCDLGFRFRVYYIMVISPEPRESDTGYFTPSLKESWPLARTCSGVRGA